MMLASLRHILALTCLAGWLCCAGADVDQTIEIDLRAAQFLTLAPFATVLDYQGEPALHYEGGENIAIIEGTEFSDGIIEVEMAFERKPTGSGVSGGIAFRATDEKSFDCVFFSPTVPDTSEDKKNGMNAIRYTTVEGSKGYYKNIRDFVGKYNAASPHFDLSGWTSIKLVIHGKSLAVYIGGAEQPCLEMDDMFGKNKSGNIALWGFNNYYRNLRITLLASEGEVSP